jgi:hypothetical protein
MSAIVAAILAFSELEKELFGCSEEACGLFYLGVFTYSESSKT